MKKYKWLLFDADGTLFDYDKAEAIALQQTLIELGYPYDKNYLAVYKRINANLWRDFENGKLAQDELKVKRFALFSETVQIESQPEKLSQNYLANLANGSYLIDDADEVVRRLNIHYQLIIITNGLKEVQRSRLARSIIEPYFEDIIISDEVGAAKPGQQIFDIAFKMMNHPQKGEVLMIGDSLSSDIQGGTNYAIDTCWYNPHKREKQQGLTITFEIHSLLDLIDILVPTP